MIQSILDNDLYKFTMQQAVHMLYPSAQVQYEFTNRGATPFPEGFSNQVKARIKEMATFKLSSEQRTFLEKSCPYFNPVYLDFLSSYTYDPSEVTITQEKECIHLNITGPWYRTILWEVPLMAIISETFFAMTGQTPYDEKQTTRINRQKAKILGENNVRFADFGTRRRFSAHNHEMVLQDILSCEEHSLMGTSNVHLAKKFNLAPIGTLAHEWFMFHAAINGYTMANPTAQDAWVKVYKGDLGIALADTYTTDIFLSTFDTFYAKLFDGVRQDSGNPFDFVDKLIRHYESLGIDPAGKIVVFSDGLDGPTAVKIHEYCNGRIKDSYGIGTHLTNDVGLKPLNMVIKLSKCRPQKNVPWQNTVKLSDDQGKHTGDPAELDICMKRFSLSRLS